MTSSLTSTEPQEANPMFFGNFRSIRVQVGSLLIQHILPLLRNQTLLC